MTCFWFIDPELKLDKLLLVQFPLSHDLLHVILFVFVKTAISILFPNFWVVFCRASIFFEL